MAAAMTFSAFFAVTSLAVGAKPNLKVTALADPPPAAAAGDQIPGEDTTANKGRKKAKASVTKYFLSVDVARDGADVTLDGGHRVPRLNKKKSDHQTNNFTIPGETAPGAYYLIACADATSRVTEKNENDNCRTSADQIGVTGVDPSDTDGDGVANTIDNCPAVSNLGQEDSDADGKGDACDACPNQANPGTQPCSVTIYDVNLGVVPVGTPVKIDNVLVTATKTGATSRVWLSVPTSSQDFHMSDYSGLEGSRPTSPGVSVGDRVDITGTVDVFQGLPHLQVGSTSVDATGNPLNPPVAKTTADLATQPTALNGVVVNVQNATISSITSGDWLIQNGVRIDNEIAALPAASPGQTFTSITGVARLGSAATVLPRSGSDIVN